MNFQEFKKSIQNFPVFSSSQLSTLTHDVQTLRNQLSYWQKDGKIDKLRRGLYLLGENDRKIQPSRFFISAQLLSPSYISLESALSRYGLIPEGVFETTCVTTRKTSNFKNSLGRFYYRHIKPSSFAGFVEEKDENGLPCFIAEPEKALVDFFYFNLSNIKTDDTAIFERSYRIKKDSGLKTKKIQHFAMLFNSKKLLNIANNFCKYIKD